MATYFGWCCDCAAFSSDSCLRCRSKNNGFGMPTMYISKSSFLVHPAARSSLATISVSLDPNAYKPTRAHEDDAGLDLYSPVNKLILPKCYAVIDTGVHIAIPKGYVGLITSKSGLMAKKGITSRGTIDCGFSGSIKAILFNHSFLPHRVRRGDKITQLVILPIITPKIEYVDKLDETERGENGFGSTGR